MPRNEKLPITRPPSVPPPTMRRSTRPYVLLALAILGVYALWSWEPAAMRRSVEGLRGFVGPASKYASGTKGPEAKEETKVPLEAHIMSKCPDAKFCLKEMVLPVMQRVHDKVDFTLSFIGRPTDNDGVDCKHGPKECMGNILELCAFELYPDPKISLGFTMCITSDYQNIPDRDLIEGCALEHAIDFKALNDCATEDNGAHGVGMLRDSVMRTSDVGVTKSCTVRLDNEIYCVRDNDEWTDCPSGPSVDQLVSAIESLYANSNWNSHRHPLA